MDAKIKWSFQEWGKLSRPTLVLLHGFLGSARDWNDLIKKFSKSHHCISPDLPGHGETRVFSSQYSFSISEMAADIANFLKEHNINSCRLLGYSMGGRIALRMAIDFPHLIECLLLESASPGIASASERKQRQDSDRRWADKLRSSSYRQFLAEWYAQSLFDSLRSHPNFRKLIERRAKYPPSRAADCIVGASPGSQPDLWDKLPEISCPVLLVAGEKDKKYVSLMQAVKKKAVAAKLEIVPNAGHNVHFENPEKYLEIISRFLKSIGEGGK